MTFSKSLAREAVNKLVDRERLRFVQTKKKIYHLHQSEIDVNGKSTFPFLRVNK